MVRLDTQVENFLKNKTGFTLIELCLVIAVIGILAVGVVINFSSVLEKSRKRTCIANLSQIDAGKEQWALDFNASTGTIVCVTELVPNYLKKMPTPPEGGQYIINVIEIDPQCPNDPDHELE